ncbi:hypothetical protein [Novosphingobium panipatense]|uniref:Fusaric acid resistance family protein n=1 Tax=Novosphingobium panipatense TaxID=428991 RepID=A0ABY1QGM5_9SPHN|nr:hypothetical protein [Novosphingobium panipatense]SMP69941.1 hypothetical protein SAMN06296065_105206 [Novosphingobium panipatense]
MRSPNPTAHHLVTAARAILPMAAAILACGVVHLEWAVSTAACWTLICGVILLMAMPRLRAGDGLGFLALFVTLLECIGAASSGIADAQRWQACIAVTGAMVLLLKVQHLRALARQDGYVPLRHLERRSAVLNRSPARGCDSVPPRRSR